MLVDRCNRRITYLRISVTDRCNLRCVYCMPPEGVGWQPHENILRYEEIMEVLRVAAEHGVTEFRLTGGEPLVRKDLADLVRMMAVTPGVEDISLTTNGLFWQIRKRWQMPASNALMSAWIRLTRKNFPGLPGVAHWKKFSGTGKSGRGWNSTDQAQRGDCCTVSMRMNWRHSPQFSMKTTVAYSIYRNDARKQSTTLGRWVPETAGDAYFSITQVNALLEPLHLQPENSKIGIGPARKYYSCAVRLGNIGFISPVEESFLRTLQSAAADSGWQSETMPVNGCGNTGGCHPAAG